MNATHGNEQKYESQNPIQRALIRRFQDSALELVRRVDPATVLDLGCGEGYTLSCLAEGGVKAELTGIELDAEAAAKARARLGDRATIEVGDARELAEAARTFDLVVMTEVLEHIHQPGQMLPILDRLAERAVLLSVPWEPFFRGLNFMRGKHVRDWGNDPEHVNWWGRSDFQRFVSGRFDIVAAPFVFPWTMVLAHKRPHAPDVN